MRAVPYLVVLTLFGSVSIATAQEASWGIKGGVNIASQHGDEDDSALKNRVGFAAGAFFTWPLSGLFSVQPEVLYSQKGSRFELPGLVEGTIELDYIEIPVLFRVGKSSGTSFNGFAGPSVGFRVRAKSTAEAAGESETIDVSDFVESVDFGVVFGGGVDFGRFTIDGRYTWGLSNIAKDEDDLVKVTNRVFSILAGVRF